VHVLTHPHFVPFTLLAVVGVRHAANEKFYGKTCTASDILEEKKVTPPEGKETALASVYEKLTKCVEAAAEPVPLKPAEPEKKDDAPTAEEGEKASAPAEADAAETK